MTPQQKMRAAQLLRLDAKAVGDCAYVHENAARALRGEEAEFRALARHLEEEAEAENPDVEVPR